LQGMCKDCDSSAASSGTLQGLLHLLETLCRPSVAGAADQVLDAGWRKVCHLTQDHPIHLVLEDQLGTGGPAMALPDLLGNDELSFGGKSDCEIGCFGLRRFHGHLPSKATVRLLLETSDVKPTQGPRFGMGPHPTPDYLRRGYPSWACL